MITTKKHWLVAGAIIGVMALFLGLSFLNGNLGFPLDDAWIHQTYARNLARNGRLEFIPGTVSAGSTAPLWTLLLTIGYLLRLPYLLWAYLLGGLSLGLLAWSGMRLWRQFWPDWAEQDWLAGLALIAAWPLVWAASSGMETLLFATTGMTLVSAWASYAWRVEHSHSTFYMPHSVFPLGFLSGLLILIRPDGLVLLLLLAVGLGLRTGRGRQRVKSMALFLGTAVLPLLPYFAFNLWANGSIWPNTSAAKQTEYAALLAKPLLSRFFQLLTFSLGGPEQGWQGMSGARLLLLPGLVMAVWLSMRSDWRQKQLYRLLPLFWAGGHIALYAWRLPVTYQHGRYLLTAVPIWIIYGLSGWKWLLERLNTTKRTHSLIKKVIPLTFVVLMLTFLLLGGQSYAQDVGFIEGEMVAVAQWLADNTPPDALIAAHDIGAIGYFAERPLLDLAGLISPEIIPLLADETAVANYLLNSQANYLVTAPGWPYKKVVENESVSLIFNSNFAWTREKGVNNTAVYHINLP